VRLHFDVTEGRARAGGGRECRRFPQREGRRWGGAGMREDHEPKLPASARARPRMDERDVETH
jgi:hypothetical protein